MTRDDCKIYTNVGFKGLSNETSVLSRKCSNFRRLYSYVLSRCRWSSGYHTSHWTQGLRVRTRPRSVGFKGNKNPQHAFLRRGNKFIGPCFKILLHVDDRFEALLAMGQYMPVYHTGTSLFLNSIPILINIGLYYIYL
jgi:hypothetical protein